MAGHALRSTTMICKPRFFSSLFRLHGCTQTIRTAPQVYVTEVLSSSKMMTIDSFGPEQSASARRGKKSKTNNASTQSYSTPEPMLPEVGGNSIFVGNCATGVGSQSCTPLWPLNGASNMYADEQRRPNFPAPGQEATSVPVPIYLYCHIRTARGCSVLEFLGEKRSGG